MDREALRNKAASRRGASEPVGTERAKWLCQFCGHEFAYEAFFMKHNCKEKQRAEELRSPIGQAAYVNYSEWMRLQKHSVPPIETFAESKFYSTFVRFTEYAKKTNLPDVKAFIKLMVESQKIPPSLWHRDNVYSMYLQAYDAAVAPEKQFVRGVDELTALAVDMQVELKDIFPALGFETLLDLVTKRKLTFWVLLLSPRFKSYLVSLPPAEKDMLASAINVSAAIVRFEQEPYLVKQFAAGLKEMGL